MGGDNKASSLKSVNRFMLGSVRKSRGTKKCVPFEHCLASTPEPMFIFCVKIFVVMWYFAPRTPRGLTDEILCRAPQGPSHVHNMGLKK